MHKTSSPNDSTDPLVITNKGAAIASTNFWTDGFAHAGKYIISNNIDLRILMPQLNLHILMEMSTGKEVIVSRGPLPTRPTEHGLEIMFDDGSDAPFSIFTSQGAVILLPKVGSSFQVTVWSQGPGGTAIRQLALPGRYRHARSLPCLKRWAPNHGRPLFG